MGEPPSWFKGLNDKHKKQEPAPEEQARSTHPAQRKKAHPKPPGQATVPPRFPDLSRPAGPFLLRHPHFNRNRRILPRFSCPNTHCISGPARGTRAGARSGVINPTLQRHSGFYILMDNFWAQAVFALLDSLFRHLNKTGMPAFSLFHRGHLGHERCREDLSQP